MEGLLRGLQPHIAGLLAATFFVCASLYIARRIIGNTDEIEGASERKTAITAKRAANRVALILRLLARALSRLQNRSSLSRETLRSFLRRVFAVWNERGNYDGRATG